MLSARDSAISVQGNILDLGLIDYEEAYRIQKDFVAKRRLGEIADSVIIAEHPPVFTIGRNGDIKNLFVNEEGLNKRGIKLLRVDRGGDITFHGPGQIVIYPIVDLKNREKDLHKYLRALEGIAIEFLNRYGVSGEKIAGRTGVWARGGKIAFIGIGSKDWITYHGLSVNINVDLNFFSMIRPCGFSDIKVASLDELLGGGVSLFEAKENLIDAARLAFMA